MRRILGLDLGTDSLGIAFTGKDENYKNCFRNGVEMDNNSFNDKNWKRNKRKFYYKALFGIPTKSKQARLVLLGALVATAGLSLLNQANWQFWLNISSVFLTALLSTSRYVKIVSKYFSRKELRIFWRFLKKQTLKDIVITN